MFTNTYICFSGKFSIKACDFFLTKAQMTHRIPLSILTGTKQDSSGDEIANVNCFTTILHTYFKISKKKNLLRITN